MSHVLRDTNLFPRDMLDAATTGWQSGSVDSMMDRYADILEQEAQDNAHRVAFVFGQIVYLLVALYVTGLLSVGIAAIIGAVSRLARL